MLKKLFYFSLLLIVIISCNEIVENNFTNDSVVINETIYEQTNTNNYTILDVKLNGNELTLKIGASGCNSNSWQATLVDSGLVLESFPVQRNIKIALENNEACLAYFEVEYTFNIQSLVDNLAPVNFNLEGWNQVINYK